ncbi:SANT protein [Geosmithia morbida]|uniref:SANT protein n=1 Tax=Geosmithia morbida TaxID=1094350 RepID=A0A9P5CYE2_9HYPO|nr:SANT protein [Geosmithia morbida]KAF4120318.1 SANT protein [Geosmithia morbida]
MMMDPSHMGHHHPHTHPHAHHAPPPPQGHYGPSIMAPLYQPMPTPTTQPGPPHHHHHLSAGSKRPRPDDLDLHAPPGLHHNTLDHHLAGMHTAAAAHTPMSATYAQAVPAHTQHHHHHHRLPDSEPAAKMMRRSDDMDVGGLMAGPSSTSVVGQEGMPEPARRPKGPKLKFTSDDDQLLIELKEKKNLTWKQIADFFPGRSSGTLQVRYCTKLKAKTKQWNRDMDVKLRSALDDYENDKWRIVSSKLGTGFTPAACRERANDLWGNEPPTDLEGISSPQGEESSPHTHQSEDMYSRPLE